jgi:hypothetical protein
MGITLRIWMGMSALTPRYQTYADIPRIDKRLASQKKQEMTFCEVVITEQRNRPNQNFFGYPIPHDTQALNTAWNDKQPRATNRRGNLASERPPIVKLCTIQSIKVAVA